MKHLILMLRKQFAEIAEQMAGRGQQLQLRHGTLISWLQTSLVVAGLGTILYVASTRHEYSFARPDIGILSLAIGINLTALFSLSKRLQALMCARQLDASFSAMNRINLQSFFYLFLLPFGVGMEAARMVKLRNVYPAASLVQLAVPVLADRVLGLFASLLTGAVAGVWLFFPEWLPYAGILAAIAVAACCYLMVLLLEVTLVAAVHTMFWTLISLLTTVAAVYAATAAFELPVGPIMLALAMTVGVVAAVVPFALAGAGVGDAAAVGTLTTLGMEPIVAALVVMLVYFGRLMGALIGGALELHGTRHQGASN